MFHKILIANRGEIACRVIETAQKLGIQCVAIYSQPDENALHVKKADEAYYVGPAPAKESYLVEDRILEIAKQSGAEAIHPGYGFLSENADFAEKCETAGIVFIGPPASAIRAMGSKSEAKRIMEDAQVSLVPGYHGDDQSPEKLQKEAEKIGYPVLLKAVAGGGGKGMRVVESPDQFMESLEAAKREGMSSFGDDVMLVEKYLSTARHVEIQVFTDQHKNGVYLFERDCSIQRRHQKIIEEAPAPGLPEKIRQEMGKSAVTAAKAIDYVGAGTVEFLLAPDFSFYFMEMNTRLQVEHPITEKITGEDLVEWQLLVAAGNPLPKAQKELKLTGHAIETRIYAEDPDNGFLPATGRLDYLKEPFDKEHVRIDTGVRQNDEISVYYDPMIAKLIVWDQDRASAIRRMRKALNDYQIVGVKTNISFLKGIAGNSHFIDADLDTQFIDLHYDELFHKPEQDIAKSAAIVCFGELMKQKTDCVRTMDCSNTEDPYSPWGLTNSWRNMEPHRHRMVLKHEDQEYLITAVETEGNHFKITVADKEFTVMGEVNGDHATVLVNGHHFEASMIRTGTLISLFYQEKALEFERINMDDQQYAEEEETSGLTAPMNGTVVKVLVTAGDTVSKDQTLLVMEAMKMEHTIKATADGTVNIVNYNVGDLVPAGAELFDIQFETE